MAKKKPHVPVAVIAGKSHEQLWREYKALLDRYEKERNAAYSKWELTIGAEFEAQMRTYRQVMDNLRFRRPT